MATTLHATGTFPDGFSTPFKRVPMEERIDDVFACIATLTNRTLAEVSGAAVKLGYPANGPAWATYPLIGKLLNTLNSLTSNDDKEFQDLGTLPDVAILLVNYDPDTEIRAMWFGITFGLRKPFRAFTSSSIRLIGSTSNIT